ncbi:hypothetical protein ACHAXT_005030 [Thalassiosira profunda]
MKVITAFAIIAASALSSAAAAPEEVTPNLRASASASERFPLVEENESEDSTCVSAYHRNCFYRNGNENARPCCRGLQCRYTGEHLNPNARGGGSTNPTNFVCVASSDRERSATDSDGSPDEDDGGDCVSAYHRNCYLPGANEEGKACCSGSTCNYLGGTARARQGGSNNPANFVCEADAADAVAAVR